MHLGGTHANIQWEEIARYTFIGICVALVSIRLSRFFTRRPSSPGRAGASGILTSVAVGVPVAGVLILLSEPPKIIGVIAGLTLAWIVDDVFVALAAKMRETKTVNRRYDVTR